MPSLMTKYPVKDRYRETDNKMSISSLIGTYELIQLLYHGIHGIWLRANIKLKYLHYKTFELHPTISGLSEDQDKFGRTRFIRIFAA